MRKSFLALIAAISLFACTEYFDPYATKFNDDITLNHTRQAVIKIMGKPVETTSYDLPFMPKLEHLTWKSNITGQIYTVVLVSDKVVSKSVI